MSRYRLAAGLLAGALPIIAPAENVAKLTYHGDAARSGWNAKETELTPRAVASGRFGLEWESPVLASAGDVPPRLFATPLYVPNVAVPDARNRAAPRRDLVFAAASTGHVYAVNARATGDFAAGTIVWQRELTTKPCTRGSYGILSTPVVDAQRQRLYVSFCDEDRQWQIVALDLSTGTSVRGWPVAINAAAINVPGVNHNGAARFPEKLQHLQRSALNLSPDGARLYVSFGGEPTPGWLVSVDTQRAAVASAFSATPNESEGNGGMWAAGGPAVDRDGNVYVATGSSVVNALAGKGSAGVFPETAGNWGQSIIKLSDRPGEGLLLRGSYAPFNYCQAGGHDLDLGSSSPVLFDIDGRLTSTPQLLALGGSKQGNVYLLDRAHMPGGVDRRQPCNEDSASDGSLLAPQPQPQFGKPGPLNVFGPYSDVFGMGDLAKSRSTPAYFRSGSGRHYLFVTGSAKAKVDSGVSVAPGFVRLQIVLQPGQRAFMQFDRAHPDVVFQNPGAPFVSSRGGRDAIVWVLDANKPRSAALYGADAPRPVLYAFDAETMQLLWRSRAGELHTSGKYNEPTITNGMAIVGTDRIQAYALHRTLVRPAVIDEPVTADERPQEDAPTDQYDAQLGTMMYEARCAQCHDTPQPGIPTRAQIVARPLEFIREKLLLGSMQPHTLGLSEAQVAQLARWLAAGAKPPP